MALPADQQSLVSMAEAREVPPEHRAHDSDGRLIGYMIVDEVTGAQAWWALGPETAWCCPHVYACPQNGELECLCHGGFDVCCGHPACPGSEANGAQARREPCVVFE